MQMVNGFWGRTALGLVCVAGACVDRSPASAERPDESPCVVTDGPKPIADVPEASGLTLGRRTPGILWAHNDSGKAELFAFDASGQPRGRVVIPNAAVDDWEDITAADCDAGTCLYIADIGDNNRSRRQITLYRIPEPRPDETQSAGAEIFTAVYPDGPHDAEGVFVASADVFVITKEASGAIYRFPRPLQAGTVMTLERVTELPVQRVTAAEVSADGAWLAVRSNDELVFYRTNLLSGETTSPPPNPASAALGSPDSMRIPLGDLDEPQGEGVALGADGTVYLASEGGAARAGTLNVLRCTLP